MTVLESVETKLGNKIELIGEIGEGQVLIIGVVHGDEPQGKYLIDEYLTPPLPNPPPQVGRGHTSYAYFLKNKAIQLRKNQTDAEKVLWNYLRANRFFGLHFKRQQPIGEYIVDFVCFSKKLIIELDGGQHNEGQKGVKDAKRTKFLEGRGYKVIRIWNDDVFNNIEGVFEYIQSSLPTRGGGLGRGGKLFIPCLNPDGMKQNTRRNANDVDINRNFPTKNWGQNLGDNATCDDETTSYYGGKAPASEIETKFVIRDATIITTLDEVEITPNTNLGLL